MCECQHHYTEKLAKNVDTFSEMSYKLFKWAGILLAIYVVIMICVGLRAEFVTHPY